MKEKLDELWPEGELRERISSEVIHCRRYVSLYPEDHPRVQGSLGTLKSLLEEHHRTTARPFFLQVSNVLETDEHPPQPTSAAELARLLETRLIEKLVIPPDVTAEALYKLCYLLREDALRQTRDQILIDLHRLPGISLSFYELHELATAAPEPPAEAPAAAPRSGVAVDDILAPLPEDARSALRNVLEDPSTAKRLESIGGLLAKESGAIDGASDERVSILREVLAAAAAPFESPDGAASAEEDVLARFETILRFLEENTESLAISPNFAAGGGTGEALRRDIASYAQHPAGLSVEVKKLQEQKQKLASIFSARAGVGSALPSPAAPPPSPSRPPVRDEAPAGPPAFLPEAAYDIGELRAEIESSEPYAPYTQIVLELLHRDDTRTQVSKRLSRISKRLAAVSKDRKRQRTVLAAAVESLASSDLKEAHEIPMAILIKLESPLEILKLFESVILPEGGAELAGRLLQFLTERNRRSAVRILCTFSRSADKTLQEAAVRRLLFLSQNQELLRSWAAEDPESLLEKEVFDRVVGRLGIQRLTEAFHAFFAQPSHRQAANFLEGLHDGLPGAEHVLLAAAQYGSPPIRKTALSSLARFASPMVVAALIETVKRNNYRNPPDLEEVDGALRALVAIGGPGVESFLEEIQSRKKGLVRAYRKEIRRAIRRILEERGPAA